MTRQSITFSKQNDEWLKAQIAEEEFTSNCNNCWKTRVLKKFIDIIFKLLNISNHN